MKIAQIYTNNDSISRITDEHNALGKAVFTDNLKTNTAKSIVIVSDETLLTAANIWFETAKASFPQSAIRLYILQDMTHSGQEPPQEIITAAKSADITILHTFYSLTHTHAGKAAIENNGLSASLPGVTQEMMLRTLQADYTRIHQLGEQLKSILENGTTITITNKAGTNITAAIRKNGVYNDGGIITPSNLGNLPAGEVFFAPLLGSAQGTWVVEASLADEQELQEKITLTIKKGQVIAIEGEQAAKRLHHKLNAVGPSAFNVAEIGIGTNPATNPYGDMIEAEKTLGTAHLAVGNSSAIGGEINVPIHIDALTLKPTIAIDDQIIMLDGTFLDLQV
jgi:leucyl aminopeptidase (aminopeptidase T)